MSKKYTYDYVKNYIESNSECKLLSTEYIRIGEKLKLQCGCKNETVFYTAFTNIKNENKLQCNECSNKQKGEKSSLGFEFVKNYIESFGNKLINNEYKNNRSKLKIKCSNCDEDYYQTFNEFKNSNYKICKKCYLQIESKERRFEYSYIKAFIEEYGLILLSKKYENNRSILTIECKCGNVFNTTFNQFKDRTKKQCNECSNDCRNEYNRTPFEEIKQYVEDFNNNKLLTLEKNYKNTHQKVKILCGKCNSVFDISIKGYKKSLNKCCQDCYSKSLGEDYIKQFLNNNNINYIPQKTFDDCNNIRPLPFDFYLPDKNIVIEFDGEFHYKVKKIGSMTQEQAEENLKQQQYRDSIKDKYCKDNNIHLLRIPYTEFNNIENILDKEMRLWISLKK